MEVLQASKPTKMLSREGIEVIYGARSFFYATLEHVAKGAVNQSETQMAQMAYSVYNNVTERFEKHRYAGIKVLNTMLPIAREVSVATVRKIVEGMSEKYDPVLLQELEAFA